MQSGEPKIVQFPTDRARERTAGALAAAQAEPLPPPGDRWELVSPAGGWGGTVLALSTPVPLLERPEEDETQPALRRDDVRLLHFAGQRTDLGATERRLEQSLRAGDHRLAAV